MSKTPDQIVAERIAVELQQLGLLSSDRAARLAVDLAAGKMKVADWNLLADAAEDSGKGESSVE